MRPSARSRAKARAKRAEPGRAEWKAPRTGRCAVCGRSGRILRHHIVYEAHVRREGGDPWDLRNSLDVGAYCSCHANHHAAVRRIPARLIPETAIDFMIELLGTDRAALYVARLYADE